MINKTLIGIVAVFFTASIAQAQPADLETKLQEYRKELEAFRAEFGGARSMPDIPFFQFGMGSRAKYLFKDGKLLEIPGGKLVRSWPGNVLIIPSEYTVTVSGDTSAARVVIREDEKGVWVTEKGSTTLLDGADCPVRLPSFGSHKYAAVLRVLHHEILVNIMDGKPVPNFYVYKKPWYRDGAMMALCLKQTGNMDLIKEWIMNLSEVFDRNNAGEMEADNPGQALFLISCVSDKNHPLVPKILDALKRFEVRGTNGIYIKGRSDFAEHPVYQTKWAKYGLRALGLEDPYVIPQVKDSYSSLFWMDFREAHVRGAEATDRDLYPYLGWATDHFLGEKTSPISNRDYPLTWEIKASQAEYGGISIVSPQLAAEKTAVPHTWHAAEIFLYLLDKR